MPGVSIRPSDFVEGGAVPVEKNLLWKECRFNLFDYGGKAPQTVAARINYVDDDGQEFEQQYSVASPERFQPSPDGKTIVAVGTAQVLNKSSNFYILMQNLISAGFPENRLSDNISALDGLYTYNIGLPEPKRAGLKPNAPVDSSAPAREKVLSVPSQILRLPWEKAKPGQKPSPKPAAGKPAGKQSPVVAESGDEDDTQLAVDFVGKLIESEGEMTRPQIGVRVFKDLAKDPNRDKIASAVFASAFQAALVAAGFTVDGEKISKE